MDAGLIGSITFFVMSEAIIMDDKKADRASMMKMARSVSVYIRFPTISSAVTSVIFLY